MSDAVFPLTFQLLQKCQKKCVSPEVFVKISELIKEKVMVSFNFYSDHKKKKVVTTSTKILGVVKYVEAIRFFLESLRLVYECARTLVPFKHALIRVRASVPSNFSPTAKMLEICKHSNLNLM